MPLEGSAQHGVEHVEGVCHATCCLLAYRKRALAVLLLVAASAAAHELSESTAILLESIIAILLGSPILSLAVIVEDYMIHSVPGPASAPAALYGAYLLYRGARDPLIENIRGPPMDVASSFCRLRHLAAAGLLLAAATATVLDCSWLAPASSTLSAVVATLYWGTVQPMLVPLAALAGCFSPLAPLILAASYPSIERGHNLCVEENRVAAGVAVSVLTKTPSILWAKHIGPLPWTWIIPPKCFIVFIPLSTRRPSHIVIAGSTGSGKSTLASRLASAVASALLVIDPHGEYVGKVPDATVLDARKAGVNPLEAFDETTRQRASNVASMIASIYRLGPLQQSILEQAILAAYEASEAEGKTPTLEDVALHLKALSAKEPRAAVVASYVESLASSAFTGKGLNPRALVSGRSIVDLSGLPTHEQKRLYVETLLRLVYSEIKSMGHTDNVRLVIVIDEAGIFSKGSVAEIIARLYAEARKYGVVMVAVTQSLRDLPEEVIANSGTRILTRHVEPEERRYAARLLSHDPSDRAISSIERLLASLGTGEYIASTSCSTHVVHGFMPGGPYGANR